MDIIEKNMDIQKRYYEIINSDEIDKILRYNINQIKKKMVNKEFPFNDEKIKEYYKQFEEETKKKGDYENKD